MGFPRLRGDGPREAGPVRRSEPGCARFVLRGRGGEAGKGLARHLPPELQRSPR